MSNITIWEKDFIVNIKDALQKNNTVFSVDGNLYTNSFYVDNYTIWKENYNFTINNPYCKYWFTIINEKLNPFKKIDIRVWYTNGQCVIRLDTLENQKYIKNMSSTLVNTPVEEITIRDVSYINYIALFFIWITIAFLLWVQYISRTKVLMKTK